jgi:hypothetical protein
MPFNLFLFYLIILYTDRSKPPLHLTENSSTDIAPNAQYPNQANINYGNSAHIIPILQAKNTNLSLFPKPNFRNL